MATKSTKTFSLDKSVLAEVDRTKGSGSQSERVNTLLKFALDLEKRAKLHEEAANFFSGARGDRKERGAFESANLAAWTRK